MGGASDDEAGGEAGWLDKVDACERAGVSSEKGVGLGMMGMGM